MIRTNLAIFALSLLSNTWAWTAYSDLAREPAFFVERYAVKGGETLPVAVPQEVFTNALGPSVRLSQICRVVAQLRKVYVKKGYSNITVFAPKQSLINGVIIIEVREQESDFATEQRRQTKPQSLSSTATNKTALVKFEVRHFDVIGNTILRQTEIDSALKTGIGPAVTLNDVRNAASNLQKAYRARGYITVVVNLPSQRLTNATLRLNVVESPLAGVEVVGNKYFSSNNVVRALPSLTNRLLNSFIFQRELDQANLNRDRQIYPVLGPGPEVGTSEMALKVKDRLPLHGRLEIDNYATPGTPELRVNSGLQYNNLWQLEHEMGVSYSFTPQEMKTMGGDPNFGLNQPQIASYSGYYRIPLGSSSTLTEQTAGSESFGYQEATHQFRLPPAMSGSDLTLYGSASSADTGVKWGGATVVSKTDLQTILSEDSAENLSENQNGGWQYRFPMASSQHIRWGAFIGGDVKHASLRAMSTNNFIISTVTTNNEGAQTNSFISSVNQPASEADVIYFPLNTGVNVVEVDSRGTSSGEFMVIGNMGSSGDYQKLSYSEKAQEFFIRSVISSSRDQNLPHGCSLFSQINAQVASGALINNEQWAVGGVNSVRGYYEGDQYGDSGWSGSVELRSPYYSLDVAGLSRQVPAWLRAFAFTDWGQRGCMETYDYGNSTVWLVSVGCGVSANVNNRLETRVVVAFPLQETDNTPEGDPRACFTIGGQF